MVNFLYRHSLLTIYERLHTEEMLWSRRKWMVALLLDSRFICTRGIQFYTQSLDSHIDTSGKGQL